MTHASGELLDTVAGDARVTASRETKLVPGSAVGRYVVLFRVGEGAMGVVYAAYDPKLDRRVALKVLHADVHEAARARRARRLTEEAQALARLSHPNVVAIHDVGEHEDNVFLAMEFVEGMTLKEWLRASGRGVDEVLAVMLQAGRGLAAAHERGLVHRDFKPDNVMVSLEGQVRVMDFGLARRTDSQPGDESIQAVPDPDLARETDRSEHGRLVGTPSYMAPEQYRGQPASPASDQFAFAVVLFEALYGRRPFEGETVIELSVHVVEDRRLTAACRSDGRMVPRWLRHALDRGLANDPDARWPSMAALLAELGRNRQRRRRRMGLVAGLVGGGVLAATVPYWTALREGERCCSESRAAAATLWNDGRARQLAGAFERTGLADAAVAEHVRTRVAAHAEAWLEARQGLCRATMVEGRLSHDLFERGLACLEEQQGRMLALLDRFEGADRQGIHRASASVADLVDPRRCTDPQALAQRMAAPVEATVRVAVAAERELMERVDVLRSTGDFARAGELAESVRTRAQAIGWTPLEAEAWRLYGSVKIGTGEYAEGVTAFERAHELAIASGHDAVALASAIELVHVLGTRLAEYDQALFWVRVASAFVDRMQLGEDDPRAIVALHHHAAVLHAKGELTPAAKLFEQVITRMQRALGEHDPRLARAHESLGLVRYSQGAYDEALTELEHAGRLFALTHGEDHPRHATVLGNAAIVHAARGEHDRALSVLEHVLAIRERALGPDHPDVANTLTNLGVELRALGRIDEVLAHYQRALTIYRAAYGDDHPRVADVLGNVANLERAQGRHAAAISNLELALAIQERTNGPDHPSVATALRNLSGAYLDVGRKDDALATASRAVHVAELKLERNHPDIVRSLRQLGAVHRAREDGDAAALVLERALVQAEAAPLGAESLAELRVELAQAWTAAGRSPRNELRQDTHALSAKSP